MSVCLNCNATLVVAVILSDKRGEYALCRNCFSSKPADLASVKRKAKTDASKTPLARAGSDARMLKL